MYIFLFLQILNYYKCIVILVKNKNDYFNDEYFIFRMNTRLLLLSSNICFLLILIKKKIYQSFFIKLKDNILYIFNSCIFTMQFTRISLTNKKIFI